MKVSFNPGRVFFSAFALVFCGCSGIATQSGSMPSGTEDATATFEEAPVDSIAANRTGSVDSTSSRLLLSRSAESPIGLEFVDGTDANKILIDTGSQNSQYKISRLQSPSRLVIDLPGTNTKKSRAFDTKDSEFVSQVRIGAHDNSSRVVLDLNDQTPVTDKINQSGNTITVTLARAGETATTTKHEPVAAISDTDLTPNLAMNSSGALPQLKGLTIESLPGEGNMVVADVTSMKNYSLQKTAPSEYVLNIEGMGLSADAGQTVLAAPNSGAIRSARPTAANGDVKIRIFAQPSSELQATAKGGKIVVKSSTEAPDFMAQPKAEVSVTPTKEEKVAGDAPKAAEGTDTGKPAGEAAPAISNDDLTSLLSGDQKYAGRLISLDLQDTDIDNALRIIAEVSNLNIIASSDVAGKVTLRLIDVPWDQALDVILKTNGLDKVQEGNVVRIAPVEKLRQERETLKQAQLAEDELEPLSVKYVRISYAKAADIKALLETVITERGTVTFDERSNQIIIKDIKKGVKNAVDLVQKLDLRTPQVLLETQIIEAQRSLFRDLGAELGFSFVQSPETGNATGKNFPNSISIGGGIPGSNNVSAFPAAVTGLEGSAMSFIFGSADGTKSLDANISALEREGRIRIVSRPAVATTNNKPAEISSNETILVKKPSGGSSTVVGGSGGTGSDTDTATEKIKAGITLKVTPQASPDYYVLMDIDANSSTFGARVVDGIPSIIERKATSTVLVSSGQTFAIGGIYKLADRDSVGGVPFFKDIPVLGALFRRTGVDNTDEELLFFITPRIVEGSFDDAAMSATS